MMFKPLDFHALRVPFRIVVCSKVKVLLRYQEADNSEFTTLVRTRRASVTKWRVFHQDDQGGKKDPDLQISSDLNIMDSNQRHSMLAVRSRRWTKMSTRCHHRQLISSWCMHHLESGQRNRFVTKSGPIEWRMLPVKSEFLVQFYCICQNVCLMIVIWCLT